MEAIREELIRKGIKKISCEEAHRLSHSYGISPLSLGEMLDELEIKIIACQLGLFGYGDKKKDIPRIESVGEELESEIRGRLESGRLPCKAAWEIADKREIPRKHIGGVCERLGIKISSCQLGAF